MDRIVRCRRSGPQRLPQLIACQIGYTLLAVDRWCDNLGGAKRLGEDFNGYSLVGCQAQCSKDVGQGRGSGCA